MLKHAFEPLGFNRVEFLTDYFNERSQSALRRIGAKYEGTGYMHEGLTLLVRYACNTLGLHRLEANIQPDNERSQRLVERCGFVREGVSRNCLFINGGWRDHVRWCFIDDRRTLRVQSGLESARRIFSR